MFNVHILRFSFVFAHLFIHKNIEIISIKVDFSKRCVIQERNIRFLNVEQQTARFSFFSYSSINEGFLCYIITRKSNNKRECSIIHIPILRKAGAEILVRTIYTHESYHTVNISFVIGVL